MIFWTFFFTELVLKKGSYFCASIKYCTCSTYFLPHHNICDTANMVYLPFSMTRNTINTYYFTALNLFAISWTFCTDLYSPEQLSLSRIIKDVRKIFDSQHFFNSSTNKNLVMNTCVREIMMVDFLLFIFYNSRMHCYLLF